jgi:hypothetical protein
MYGSHVIVFILTLNTHSSFLPSLLFLVFLLPIRLVLHRAMSVDHHIDDLGNRLSPRTPQMWKVDMCDLGITTLTPDSLFGLTETRGAVLGSY